MTDSLKLAPIFAVVMVALVVQPAAARTYATKALKDAAIEHDLARARQNFKRIVEGSTRQIPPQGHKASPPAR